MQVYNLILKCEKSNRNRNRGGTINQDPKKSVNVTYRASRLNEKRFV